MPEEEKQEGMRRPDTHFLIPAGAVIGLGIGILADRTGAGFLVGLGLGFAGSGLLPAIIPGGPAPSAGYGVRWSEVIIGAFLVLLGTWIVWEPPVPWTYIIALIFILMGIWVIVRGFGRMR